MKASEGFLDAIEAITAEASEMEEIINSYWAPGEDGEWRGSTLRLEDDARVRELRAMMAESLRSIDRMMGV